MSRAEWMYLANRLENLRHQIEALGADPQLGPEQADFIETLQAFLDPLLRWRGWQNRRWPASEPLGPQALILALSFGIEEDGSPGIVNNDLAGVLNGMIQGGQARRDQIWAQWEIADELNDRHNITIPAARVIEPFAPFAPTDIVRPHRLAQYIQTPPQAPASPKDFVCREVNQLLNHQIQDLRERLADALNKLAGDRNFCARYLSFLRQNVSQDEWPQLMNLERWTYPGQQPVLVGYETRRLPLPDAIASTGRMWQRERVNRLIIDNTFPTEIKRGTYLSTRDVCERVAKHLDRSDQGEEPVDIILVVHPDHFYKCYCLLKRFAEEKGRIWRVYFADVCQGIDYVVSAQSWVASALDWWLDELMTWKRGEIEREIARRGFN